VTAAVATDAVSSLGYPSGLRIRSSRRSASGQAAKRPRPDGRPCGDGGFKKLHGWDDRERPNYHSRRAAAQWGVPLGRPSTGREADTGPASKAGPSDRMDVRDRATCGRRSASVELGEKGPIWKFLERRRALVSCPRAFN
jgi:hypothetical protein